MWNHTPEAIEKIRAAALKKRHSSETRKRISLANTGKRFSLEHKRKISDAAKRRFRSKESLAKVSAASKRHFEADPVGCQCGPHKAWRRDKRTGLELTLRSLLTEFPEVEEQKQFGRYCVDVYLPLPYHLAFEADGAYWHQNPEKDAARDRWLLRKFDLPVVRLSEQELKEVCGGTRRHIH